MYHIIHIQSKHAHVIMECMYIIDSWQSAEWFEFVCYAGAHGKLIQAPPLPLFMPHALALDGIKQKTSHILLYETHARSSMNPCNTIQAQACTFSKISIHWHQLRVDNS